jgi:hypothetical protein
MNYSFSSPSRRIDFFFFFLHILHDSGVWTLQLLELVRLTLRLEPSVPPDHDGPGSAKEVACDCRKKRLHCKAAREEKVEKERVKRVNMTSRDRRHCSADCRSVKPSEIPIQVACVQ